MLPRLRRMSSRAGVLAQVGRPSACSLQLMCQIWGFTKALNRWSVRVVCKQGEVATQVDAAVAPLDRCLCTQ